jgi:hypothetical protein
VKRRLNKSLSDLDGTDPYIHGGTVRGIMREVCHNYVFAKLVAVRFVDRRDGATLAISSGSQSSPSR